MLVPLLALLEGSLTSHVSAGVIKCALALEYGLMPGNLHYHRDTPNPESEGLRDGTLEVRTVSVACSYMALSRCLYNCRAAWRHSCGLRDCAQPYVGVLLHRSVHLSVLQLLDCDASQLVLAVMQVVDTTRPFEGGLMALSSFGFGGANMHLVMDGHKAGQRLQLVTVDSGDAKRDTTIPLAARTADGLAYLARIVIEVQAC